MRARILCDGCKKRAFLYGRGMCKACWLKMWQAGRA